MKTKIIYISGHEVFDMADIRAAFEGVRSALGLGDDTVLFGVPVDADCALAGAAVTADVVAEPVDAACDDAPTADVAIDVAPVVDAVAEPEIEIMPETDSTVALDDMPVAGMDESDMAIVEDVAPDAPDDVTPIVPITSILTAVMPAVDDVVDTPIVNDASDATDVVAPVPDIDDVTDDVAIGDAPVAVTDVADVEIDDVVDDAAKDVIDDVADDMDVATDDVVTDAMASDEDVTADTVSVDDMVMDDTPPVSAEKTLEQLLESMTPLREDREEDVSDMPSDDAGADASDAAPADDGAGDIIDIDATDATLEQLAAEFVESQDKIMTSPEPQTRGKIGKLKNILPFKKARRDDGGLMGDLFGWAGIAANDEEFSMPGFFANAGTKK